MDDSETEAWTQVNLQQLLATMKSTLPGHVRNLSYITAQKTVDWNKVAFPPFSPEACQEKWKQILRKLSKTRSLIELIDQANGVITNPVKKVKIHPECPKRPAPPTAIFFEENGSDYQKKHPDKTRQNLLMKLTKKYKGLSCEEKLKRQYVVELKQYLKNFDEETQKRIIKETGIKRPTWLKTLSAAQQKLYRRHNPSKRQYLDAVQMDVYKSGTTCAPIYRPSDSEDEDTEESEDEESNVESDEEDEEDDVIVFEMY
ncbi:Nucleolar transcription factor 1-B [Liparis tanakae]|uniref:Nucleolar transcription factor 1-B n=1 Tax=Liparis tanakae TaxID=230148 RepID=A0A4Z2HIA9_9TELE|nr:Nucleolar transcription factor 1-B [Liparis tanakae]